MTREDALKKQKTKLLERSVERKFRQNVETDEKIKEGNYEHVRRRGVC